MNQMMEHLNGRMRNQPFEVRGIDAEKAQLSTKEERFNGKIINRYIDSCKYKDKLIKYMEEKLNAETTQSLEGSC